MYYITDKSDIQDLIFDLCETDILWLDTEVADYQTQQPHLSLIQILAYPESVDGSRTCIIDVLGKPEIVELFQEQIMFNPSITKVFHNAKYDLRFLGKTKAKNIVCTLELARKIPYYLLPVSNYTLKTLVETLTIFKTIDKEAQESNWGIRPLTAKQLAYAKLEPVYLSQLYLELVKLEAQVDIDPATEDLELLIKRYEEIEEQWKLLDSEITHLQKKIKQAMFTQEKLDTSSFKLTKSQRNTIRTELTQLVELVNSQEYPVNFPVNLTKDIQKQLGQDLEKLVVEVETKEIYSLKRKSILSDEL